MLRVKDVLAILRRPCYLLVSTHSIKIFSSCVLLCFYGLDSPSVFAGGQVIQSQSSSPQTTHSEESIVITPKRRMIVKLKEDLELLVEESTNDSSINGSSQSLSVQSLSGGERQTSLLSNQASSSGTQLNLVRSLALSQHHVVNISAFDDDSLEQAISDLQNHESVEYVEEDIRMYPLKIPNDEYFNYQWSLFDPKVGILVDQVWEVVNGRGSVVAVLDTGYTNHKDLEGQWVSSGYDFISDPQTSLDGDGRDADAFDEGDGDPDNLCGQGGSVSSWHGTHVAGTIAALQNNQIGIVGVAPQAKILPVRVLGRCGGFASDIADAILWASGNAVDGVPINLTPADVINLSLGGRGTCSNITQAAIDAAVLNGSTMVIAAGNDNEDVALSTPANCRGVISVAAVNRSGSRAFYSNYGPGVDIAAPGGEITGNQADGIVSSVDLGPVVSVTGGFSFYQGTSMAAPHVAGIAALLYELDPLISPQRVKELINQTATDFPGECEGCGAGIANARSVINFFASLPPTPGTVASNDEFIGDKVAERLRGTPGNWQVVSQDVLTGTERIRVTLIPEEEGQGDADLYIKFGEEPTFTSYDCRPNLSGSQEQCIIQKPQAGTWYIGVRGSSSYSDISIFFDDSTPL